MIVRLVKLTFQPEKVADFLALFKSVEEKIRNFPGCRQLHLFKDVNNQNVFFTYSVWESLDELELYRLSALFQVTWAQTKVCFLAPAEAWSLDQMVINSC